MKVIFILLMVIFVMNMIGVMLIYYPISNSEYSAASINELMQDMIATEWGLSDALNATPNRTTRCAVFPGGDALSLDVADSGSLAIRSALSRYTSVTNQGVSSYFTGEYIQWTPNVGFSSFIQYSPKLWSRFLPFTAIYGAILLVLAVWLSHKNMIGKLPFVILAIFGLWVVSLLFRTNVYWRDYNNTYHEVLSLAKQNQNELADILNSANQTGLVSAEFLIANSEKLAPSGSSISLHLYPDEPQEKNICGNQLFVSDGKLFFEAYIRINVDAYTYVFWKPGSTIDQMGRINHRLTFVDEGDGFWVGYYQERINDLTLFIIMHYTFIVVGIVILVVSLKMLLKKWKNPKNCT